jgi:hypothetical protein
MTKMKWESLRATAKPCDLFVKARRFKVSKGKPVSPKRAYAIEGNIIEFLHAEPVNEESRFKLYLNSRQLKTGLKFETLAHCLQAYSQVEALYDDKGYLCVVALSTANQKREMLFTKMYVEDFELVNNSV